MQIIKFKNTIQLSFLLILVSFSYAQNKEESIQIETVNVVKPYTPTISDAFKIKEIPNIEDEETNKKEPVKYSYFYFPVVSTFIPLKGKAEVVEEQKKENEFKSYANVGIGNYGTFISDLFLLKNINKNSYFAGNLKQHYAFSNLPNTVLTSTFYNTAVDALYGENKDNFAWKADLGFKNEIYNWYGLPVNFGATLSSKLTNQIIKNIDPKQSYNTFTMGGNLDWYNGIFNNVTLRFNHFSDIFGSSENRFYAKPISEFSVNDHKIKTNFILDFLGGNFDKNYADTKSIKYKFTNIGLEPSFEMKENDLTLNIGLGLYYSLNTQTNKNKVLIAPRISFSYPVVLNLMTFYGGLTGDLKQNTYQDFVNQNPFVSPTLNIMPTLKIYDFYTGLKGKITHQINYDIKASFKNEKNKFLFKANDYDVLRATKNYAYGNSFEILYDDIKTLQLYGELKTNLFPNLIFAIDGELNTYNLKYQTTAWNLPTIKTSIKLNYNISKKWFTGLNLFYTGSRKDYQFNANYIDNHQTVNLKSYSDLNAYLDYKYNDRWAFFIKANNIFNQNYQQWLNFEVQGLQIVAGANYKFDL